MATETAAVLWPWLAVAAAGALHGMNPAGGWAIAAACGARPGERSRALRALVPIAGGHFASVLLVATAVAAGRFDYRDWMLAGAALVFAIALVCRKQRATASLAVGAFVVSTLHGAGLMLVPAFASLCLADTPGRTLLASGSMAIGLAVVAVHMAAMLGVTGALALLGLRAQARLRRSICRAASSSPTGSCG